MTGRKTFKETLERTDEDVKDTNLKLFSWSLSDFSSSLVPCQLPFQILL